MTLVKYDYDKGHLESSDLMKLLIRGNKWNVNEVLLSSLSWLLSWVLVKEYY